MGTYEKKHNLNGWFIIVLPTSSRILNHSSLDDPPCLPGPSSPTLARCEPTFHARCPLTKGSCHRHESTRVTSRLLPTIVAVPNPDFMTNQHMWL